RGQAMGLNVCTLFIGFGAGSLLFQALLTTGFTAPVPSAAHHRVHRTVIGLYFFASERPHPMPSVKDPR
ncbi:MFS transporter, partial [Mycobacterium pyrenivorans]|nr:MFS transporter [Mycolicibacterium pyrenivorans]